VRRRRDKPTVRIPHRTLREVASAWHAALNSASEGALWAPSSTERGDSLGPFTAIAASSERENGHREPKATIIQPEG